MNSLLQLIILVTLISIVVFTQVSESFNTTVVISILTLDFIALTSFVFLKKEPYERLKGQYVRISVLFLISFIIAHFQVYVDLILNNVAPETSFLWISKSTISSALLYSSIAFVSYLFGYSIVKKKGFNHYEKKLVELRTNLLFIIAIIFLFLFYLTVNKSYIGGNYGSVEMGSTAVYMSLLFECAINAILLVNVRNLIIAEKRSISFRGYIKAQQKPLFLLVIYLVFVLLSGDRGPIIYNVLFFLFGFIFVTKLKFKPYQLLTFLIIGATVITFLGLMRRINDDHSFIDRIFYASEEVTEKIYYPNSISENTRELATSARCVNIAVDLHDSGFNHTYGLFALQDLMLLFPGLKGTFISVFSIPKYLTSSAQLFTFVNQGQFSTWGVGTSCVADTYIDFGLVGLVLIFGLFGYVSRRLEVISIGNNVPHYIILICIFCIFSYCVYIPRATILYSLNKLFYIAVFIAVNNIINKKRFS